MDFPWRTDPLADAVMQEFASQGALCERALAKGIESVPRAPELACSRKLGIGSEPEQ